MNKSMQWIMDSLNRHLEENNQPKATIYDIRSEDDIILVSSDTERNWLILQYLFSICIKHINIWTVLYKDDCRSTTYIRFDIKDECDCKSGKKELWIG